MDTPHHIAKFLSSQQTENSEARKQILSLGKLLVEELKLDPGVDTLSRWMAHYVAEQITVAEKSTGDIKRVAEERCFETILQLWQHRSAFVNGHRPFESFEPIYNALDRLNPDNPRPFYFSSQHASFSNTNEENEQTDGILKIISAADSIDRTARILIEFLFHQAALMAIDEKTADWIINAVAFPSNDDSIIAVKLTNTYNDVGEETIKEEHIQNEIIKTRIKQLDSFIDLSQEIRSLLQGQLTKDNEEFSSNPPTHKL